MFLIIYQESEDAFSEIREILSFSSVILGIIDIGQYVTLSHTEKDPPSPLLPFDISEHPDAHSFSATSTLTRLKSDAEVYANEAKTEQNLILKVQNPFHFIFHHFNDFLFPTGNLSDQF